MSVDLSQAPATVVEAFRRISGIQQHGYTFLDSAGKPHRYAYADLYTAAETRARALLGKRLDDEVRVHTPAGEREFVIADIAYEAPP